MTRHRLRGHARRGLQLRGPDAIAASLLDAYYDRYVGNRGALPRMAVGMMPEYGQGYPVRNPDGGENIAYFTSADIANSAIGTCDRKYRR